MIDLIAGATTCFALILTPNGGGPSAVIQNYPTYEAAKEAQTDAMTGTTAKDRADSAAASERYKNSPEYAAEQQRERELDTEKFVCENWKKVNSYVQCSRPFSAISIMSVTNFEYRPFARSNIISMPCLKEDH